MLRASASYGDGSGRLTVKRYGGQITAVQSSDGRWIESSDSPAIFSTPAQRVSPVIFGLLGPWLVITIFALLRHPRAIKDVFRLLQGRLPEPRSKAA